MPLPTEINRYVNPDSTAGGDGTTPAITGDHRAYISLNSCETAEQQDLPGVPIEYMIIHCDTNGTADTTAVTFFGWSTNSTSYIQVQCDIENRMTKAWDNYKYRLSTSVTSSVWIQEDYVSFIGVPIESSASANDNRLFIITGIGASNLITISHCRLRMTATTSNALSLFKINDADLLVRFYNNFVHNNSTSTATNNNCIYCVAGTIYVENNTLHGGAYSLKRGAGTLQPKNNILYSANQGTHSGTLTSPTYNSTDMTPGTGGAGSRTLQSFSFEDESNFDYRLNSTDTGALDHGTDLSGGDIVFTDDILGNTRTGSWDIGAHEYQGGDHLDRIRKRYTFGSDMSYRKY